MQNLIDLMKSYNQIEMTLIYVLILYHNINMCCIVDTKWQEKKGKQQAYAAHVMIFGVTMVLVSDILLLFVCW